MPSVDDPKVKSRRDWLKQFFSWRFALVNSKLQSTTKHVALTLSIHMNDSGKGTFPSIATLMRETGLSNRCVITHLYLAAKAGWIKIAQGGEGGRGWRKNQYDLCWPDEVVNDVHNQEIEAVNVVHHVESKVVNVLPDRGERGDIEVVNDVHTNSIKRTLELTQKPKDGYTPEFITLWKAYPRKDGKADAFKEFKKANINGDLGLVLRSIEEHKQTKDWQKDEGQFIPWLCRFIKGRRWEDEPDESI